MAEPLWGMLAKSAVDNETVEEAIARLITAHEAAETSHLGAGESLEAHKAAEIIDHPPASVVADKISPNEIRISTIFETDSLWDWYGYYKGSVWPGVSLRTNTTNGNAFGLYTQEMAPFTSSDITKNLLFQFTVAIDTFNCGDFGFRLGGSEGDSGVVGLGFYTTNNTIYAYYNDGVDVHTLSIGTVSNGDVTTLRAIFNPITNKIDYYIDDVLEGSIDFVTPDPLDQDLTPMFYGEKMRGVSQAILHIYNLTIVRNI